MNAGLHCDACGFLTDAHVFVLEVYLPLVLIPEKLVRKNERATMTTRPIFVKRIHPVCRLTVLPEGGP